MILHRFAMLETIAFVGVYRGIIRNQGFLGGASFLPSTVWSNVFV